MNEHQWLTERFDERRHQLRAVSHRMLGNPSDADAALMQARLRIRRACDDHTSDLGNWLSTIVACACVDKLRSRIRARTRAASQRRHQPSSDDPRSLGPDADALLADSLGSVLLDRLQPLTPTERLAFVLHQLFGLSFTEIAPMLALSPAAAAEAARHARRRLHSPALDTLRADDPAAVPDPGPRGGISDSDSPDHEPARDTRLPSDPSTGGHAS